MIRLTRAAFACTALSVSLTGCTGLFTQRAVTAFARSLESKDIAQLKAHSSKEFEDRALRLPEAVQDLKLTNLPQGKVKVISIEEQGRDARLVKVEFGDTKKTADFRLTRERSSGRWVVDDVIVATSKNSEKTQVTRSVTEQMNLLLSVRELITEWQSDDRERILAASTPELRKDLEGLPPAWLDRVTSRVAGDGPLRSFRPEAQMLDDRAVVGLSRGSGTVLMDFRLVDGQWRLNDASWNGGNEDEIKSVRKLSVALSQSRHFLEAYSTGDKSTLARLATPEFERHCLSTADLQKATIPVMDLLTKPFDVRQHDRRVDVLLSTNDATYTVNVLWQTDIAEAPTPGDAGGAEARVDDLTIYDGKDGQVKRLTAMFQSQAVVEVYSKLLAQGDPLPLRQLSSSSFNETVWKRFTPDVLHQIRIPEIEAVSPRVVTTVFNGPVTEVTVEQGSRYLTYVLNNENGRLVVDDVLMPVVGRPASYKRHLQLLGPIHEFADGLRRGDRDALVACSGAGLDRIVWEQVAIAPDIGIDLLGRLTAPVHTMKPGERQSRVTLTDGSHSAEVELELENGRYVVADVLFMENSNAAPTGMLQAFRRQISDDIRTQHLARPTSDPNFLRADGTQTAYSDDRLVTPL